MTHIFPFHGTISQCWDVFYSEYRRLNKSLGRPPFEFESPKHSTIHEYIPQDGDEIIIYFWDADHKETLLVVEAEIVPDQDREINIFVHPQGNSYQEPVKSAISIWREVKNTINSRGYLANPGAGLNRPSMPAKPARGSSLDVWFDWYHNMHKRGYKCTLGDIAKEVSLYYGHVRQLHANYARARGLLRLKKRPDKN